MNSNQQVYDNLSNKQEFNEVENSQKNVQNDDEKEIANDNV